MFLPHVPVMITFGLELDPAGVAAEWLNPGVHSFVSVKLIKSCEDFETLQTCVKHYFTVLSAVVSNHVCL